MECFKYSISLLFVVFIIKQLSAYKFLLNFDRLVCVIFTLALCYFCVFLVKYTFVIIFKSRDVITYDYLVHFIGSLTWFLWSVVKYIPQMILEFSASIIYVHICVLVFKSICACIYIFLYIIDLYTQKPQWSRNV
jgi:hypothetical protein